MCANMNRFECLNRDDVVKYLVSWLTVTDDSEEIYKCGYKLEMGYRTGFMTHQVWHNEDEGKYIFYASENSEWNGSEKDVMVYPSFVRLLEGVAKLHADAWGIKN
jgi:hypothetical protein